MFLIDTRTPARPARPGAGACTIPARTQLGREQRDWLLDGLDASTRALAAAGQSSIIGQTWAPDMPEELRAGLR